MVHVNTRNKFDKRDSLELGLQAERLFAQIAKSRGWEIVSATKRQNIDEHWDFEIGKSGTKYRVEVKSRKRIRRGDDGTQSRLTWVELHGVRPNDMGWLFGKADVIAFEREDSFLLVRKADLLKIVNRKVDVKTHVSEPQAAEYRVYKRPGRNDELTLVHMDDLEAILFDEWSKT